MRLCSTFRLFPHIHDHAYKYLTFLLPSFFKITSRAVWLLFSSVIATSGFDCTSLSFFQAPFSSGSLNAKASCSRRPHAPPRVAGTSSSFDEKISFVRQACFPSLSPLPEIPSATMSYYGNWQAIVSLTYRWLTGRETINLDFEGDARWRGRGGFDRNIITCY